MPPGTKVFVSGTHPKKPEWHYVTATLTGKLVRGYVQYHRITTNLPEPSATLYYVKKDKETLRPLSISIYHQDVKPGQDLRFYEQTVLYLTQQAGLGGASWGMANVNGTMQMSVLLKKDEFVWLPSPAFAKTLAGKVPSGSITGGAVAQAKSVSRRLEDVLASISQSPQHLSKVGAEYKKAILDHLPQIIGVTAAFMAGEGLSALLAATPTGIGQLAAAAIQLGLGAWAAYGAMEAIQAALPYAEKWLMTAWKANGDPKQIAIASENFVYMVVQIALAAMALLGARGNIGKGMKLMENVKITPPTMGVGVLATPNGHGIPIPVFEPGSITATGTAAVRPGVGSVGPASGQLKPGEAEPTGTPASDLEKALANKNLTDEQIEALLQKTKNWEELKNYIGMKADKTATPPPGYEWFTVDGKTLIRRMKGNKASGEYAPLTVQDGVVVLKAGGSNRITVYSRYRRNFLNMKKAEGEAAYKTALNQIDNEGYQLHHMIADNVAQENVLTKEALKRVQNYTPDRGPNMIAMPTKRVPGEPIIHNGSHPLFDKYVSGMLEEQTLRLTRKGQLPIEQVAPELIDKAIREVEDTLRFQIQHKRLPPNILKELEEGGMKLSFNAPTSGKEALA